MLPNKARFFIMAITEQAGAVVRHSNLPNGTGNDITVFSEQEEPHAHNTVSRIEYQAIVRNSDRSDGETLARLIAAAVREANSLQGYYGICLTAAMNNSTNPITFTPDDGAGNSKAAQFVANDYVKIGSEILKVTGVAGNNVTASRAALGTTIAAHSDSDDIYNISHDPVPTIKSNSTYSETGVLPFGIDDQRRWEFSISWFVRLMT